MKLRTTDLTGAALDWAVAKAKGYADFVLDAIRFLDMHETGHYNYSTEWSQGGPIIERERVAIRYDTEKLGWVASFYEGDAVYGPTPLIAAMRCYVASRLGDEIYVLNAKAKPSLL